MSGDSPEDSQRAVPSAAPARARASFIATVGLRLSTIEGWLAEGMLPRQAASRAMKPPPDGLGLERRTANRYVGAAIARLQGDATLEPTESKRARIVAMLQAQIQRALSLKRTFVTNGEAVTYDSPDLKAANQAIVALAEIEGVKAPKT